MIITVICGGKKSQNTEKYTEENLKTGVNTIGILVNFLPEVEKDL